MVPNFFSSRSKRANRANFRSSHEKCSFRAGLAWSGLEIYHEEISFGSDGVVGEFEGTYSSQCERWSMFAREVTQGLNEGGYVLALRVHLALVDLAADFMLGPGLFLAFLALLGMQSALM